MLGPWGAPCGTIALQWLSGDNAATCIELPHTNGLHSRCDGEPCSGFRWTRQVEGRGRRRRARTAWSSRGGVNTRHWKFVAWGADVGTRASERRNAARGARAGDVQYWTEAGSGCEWCATEVQEGLPVSHGGLREEVGRWWWWLVVVVVAAPRHHGTTHDKVPVGAPRRVSPRDPRHPLDNVCFSCVCRSRRETVACRQRTMHGRLVQSSNGRETLHATPRPKGRNAEWRRHAEPGCSMLDPSVTPCNALRRALPPWNASRERTLGRVPGCPYHYHRPQQQTTMPTHKEMAFVTRSQVS